MASEEKNFDGELEQLINNKNNITSAFSCVTPSIHEITKKYDITVKDSFITIYDAQIEYQNEEGKLTKIKTDKVTLTLVYKGEPVKTLNCYLHPKKDYGVELRYEADDTEYSYTFNLKYLELVGYRDSIWDQNISYLFIDSNNKPKSIKLKTDSKMDATYMCGFLYLIMVNNIYDEKTNERKNRINPPVVHNPDSVISKFFGSGNSVPILNTPAQNTTVTTNDSEDPYKELDNLIGLDNIKEDVKQLAGFIKVQQQRKQMGLPQVPVSLHLVFTGNPGTGKTTVARIIAKIYKDIGVLSKGQLVESDRASLVAEYVGQTAVKTQKKIQEAMGGVLFIDEAYTLAKGESKDFGQEAIDTILKAMEDNRDKFVVIVAGYPDLMKKFITSNPGLESRFNKYMNFPDYSEEDMLEIFYRMCDKYEYQLEDAAREKLKEIIHEIEINKDVNFANARTVRNIFETIITRQAARLASENAEKDEMTTIKAVDFEINE